MSLKRGFAGVWGSSEGDLGLENHTCLNDLRGFLAGSPDDTVQLPEHEQACVHIGKIRRRFSYWRLGRADKGLLQRYLALTTGLSRPQLKRLIARYLAEGELKDRWRGGAKPLRRKYERADIPLLTETDELHSTLALLQRAWEVFGDERFRRLAGPLERAAGLAAGRHRASRGPR